MKPGYVIGAVLVLCVLAIGTWMIFFPGDTEPERAAEIAFRAPELSALAREGQVLFDNNCSTCHGVNASGSKQGPPLVHKFYERNHHGNGAFMLAAKQGVRAHHWNFGDMPVIEGVSETDVTKITAYVRALQRANGIR